MWMEIRDCKPVGHGTHATEDPRLEKHTGAAEFLGQMVGNQSVQTEP